MKQKGTYWVPTLVAGEWVAEKAKEPGYFPEIVRVRRPRRSGRRFAPRFESASVRHQDRVWTDTGVSPHGQNAREFELMVAGGMPPMRAIHPQP